MDHHATSHHGGLLRCVFCVAYNPQQKLIDYCASKGIHCTAYSPLGSVNSTLLQDETINKIATARNKTPAQIILSWGYTRTSVLPKSVKSEVG